MLKLRDCASLPALLASVFVILAPAAADTLFIHGHIYTGNPKSPWAEARSDWPCTLPPDPFLGIQQAVTREVWRSADSESVIGDPFDCAGQGGAARTGDTYLPQERISVLEAVQAYTRGSAYVAFLDDRVGTLEAGKEADLVVLSRDLFSVPHESIGTTRAEMTMVGGKMVYRAQAE